MSYYHIIIQQERRTEPARMAVPISTSTPTGNIIKEEWDKCDSY